MSKPSKQLKLVVKGGIIQSIYDDALVPLFDQARKVDMRRASHVEPDAGLRVGWSADLSPVGGPVLRYFKTRQDALDAEAQYINQHVIEGST
jgi:hypothetical protein